MIKAIFFDFGGVITTSPFEAFTRFEQEQGLPDNFIRQINATNPDENAWALLERNDIDLAKFDELFLAESSAAGHPIKGSQIIALLAGNVRPEMLNALKLCKTKFKIACLTNNVNTGTGPGMSFDQDKTNAINEAMALFDFILESSKAGVRKPEQAFYELACEAMSVTPDEVIFLDDLGINLKTARAMGMTTIKVTDAHSALEQLAKLTDLPLI